MCSCLNKTNQSSIISFICADARNYNYEILVLYYTIGLVIVIQHHVEESNKALTRSLLKTTQNRTDCWLMSVHISKIGYIKNEFATI